MHKRVLRFDQRDLNANMIITIRVCLRVVLNKTPSARNTSISWSASTCYNHTNVDVIKGMNLLSCSDSKDIRSCRLELTNPTNI